MSEQVGVVNKVDRIRESKEKGKSADDRSRRGTGSIRRGEGGNDSVEISEEARERASGKRRKSILEYLEEEKV